VPRGIATHKQSKAAQQTILTTNRHCRVFILEAFRFDFRAVTLRV
jgi:hypothetical protein